MFPLPKFVVENMSSISRLNRNPITLVSSRWFHSGDLAISIATQLSSCFDLQQLNQIYAHIVRTNFLGLNSAPFHWNNMIRAYTRLDRPNQALRVYASMSRAGVLPDCYTIPIVLKSAGQVFSISAGGQIHSMAVKLGLQTNEYCESGLISLYSKCGEPGLALKVFDESPDRKLGSWNAVIAGLCQSGRPKEAIEMFLKMMKRGGGLRPDDVTMVSVTSACGSIGDLQLAFQLHKCVFQATTSMKPDTLMLNSLIDMYGKCGRMDLAHKVFSTMAEESRNVSSWTSMIVGYASHGEVDSALECFHSMRRSSGGGVRPNHVTFVGVLSACVHGGRVEEGRACLEMMRQEYGLKPQLQHYGCVVDLLGRVGLLKEAREAIEGMEMEANVVIYGCLMGACEKYGDVEMGEWVCENLRRLEPWNDGAYVVLSNIYANRGMWRQVEKLRVAMKERKLDKVPGYSLAT